MLWVALLVSIPLRGFNPAYLTAAVVGLVLLGTFGGLILLLMKGRDRAERVIRAIARKLPFVQEDGAATVVRQIATRLQELAANRPLVYAQPRLGRGSTGCSTQPRCGSSCGRSAAR